MLHDQHIKNEISPKCTQLGDKSSIAERKIGIQCQRSGNQMSIK